MKFKFLFNKILNEEEKILNQNGYKKEIASQSYYFLCIYFKLKVLYNKEACDKTVWRHWFYDEFVGNSLKRAYFYFTGRISKDEIVNALTFNLENNVKRLKGDVLYSYKDLIVKNDLDDENIKKLAFGCYNRFADYVINNRPTKNELTKKDYKKLGYYILDIKE